MRAKLSWITTLLLAAVLMSASAMAQQSWPNRTITLVNAYAAGGTGDVVARLIATKLSQTLGQSVVVENRPGASGSIGTQYVARSAPDGYTILVGQTAEISINQHLNKHLGYNPDTDLVPVALAADFPLALVIPPHAPYDTLQGLLDAARGSKKGMSFASAGLGTPGYFAGELLKLRTKADLVHVPYKGDALNGLVGGHIDMFFSGYGGAMSHIKSGNIKILAVSSAQRSASSPTVPTVAEVTGIKEFDLTIWQGFFVPRGTPTEIVTRLNTEINAVLAQPDVKQILMSNGGDVRPMSIEQFGAFVKAQSEKYQRLIKETGITIE